MQHPLPDPHSGMGREHEGTHLLIACDMMFFYSFYSSMRSCFTCIYSHSSTYCNAFCPQWNIHLHFSWTLVNFFILLLLHFCLCIFSFFTKLSSRSNNNWGTPCSTTTGPLWRPLVYSAFSHTTMHACKSTDWFSQVDTSSSKMLSLSERCLMSAIQGWAEDDSPISCLLYRRDIIEFAKAEKKFWVYLD